MNENIDIDEFVKKNKAYLDVEHLKAIAQARSVAFHPNAKERGLVKLLHDNNVPLEEMLVMPSNANAGKKNKKKKKDPIKEKIESLNISQMTESQRRAAMRDSANKKHRVIVRALAPSDQDLKSCLVEAGNSYIGEFRVIVPFNTPVYLEEIILKHLTDPDTCYQKFETSKGPHGIPQVKSLSLPKYHVQMLEGLSEKELQSLAEDQYKRGVFEEDNRKVRNALTFS